MTLDEAIEVIELARSGVRMDYAVLVDAAAILLDHYLTGHAT